MTGPRSGCTRLGRSLLIAVLVASGICPLVAGAQESNNTVRDGEQLEIYVMTMGPGDQVWSRFGHNAIGIRDLSAGTDIVYNWGTFDFAQQNFLLRFIQGKMLYWVAEGDARMTELAYARDNRRTEIQELRLSPEQRVAVRDFIAVNMREENRFYRYDYFVDNCSTRLRDVLDHALGGALSRQFADVPSGMTFRSEARRLMEPDPWTYTGIDAGLGSPSDREMTRWESMFIPMRLRDMLREVRVADDSGAMVSLVSSERVVVDASREPELAEPADHTFRYLTIGGVAALVIILAGVAGGPGTTIARFVGILWCIVAGVLGLVLIALWTVTDHTWAYRNANLLFFHPLWFVVIPLVKRSKDALSPLGTIVLVTCLVLAAIGLAIAALGRPQDIGQMAALSLPIIAAVTAFVAAGKPAPAMYPSAIKR